MDDRLFVPIVGWDEILNVGDQVMLDVTDHVLGYHPFRVGNDVEHVLGIGSLFFLASPNSHIWGSGILLDEDPVPPIRAENIRALRGLRTADRLTREGYRLPDVPFGDPGVLISEYVKDFEADPAAPAKEIVLIPHHSTYARWAEGRFAGSKEVGILDPCTNKTEFLREILAAKIVISESLHGLIFASALNRPAVWIGDNDAGTFKYHDWFSMVDDPPEAPLDGNEDLARLVGAARVHRHRIQLDDLRRSFPREVATRLDGARIGYRAARDQNPYCFFFQDHHRPLSKGDFSATFCFDLAASVADVLFSCWYDRPYAIGIVHRYGVLPNRRQLDRIVYEMDHHRYHDFAVIAPSRQVVEAGLQMHRLGGELAWAVGRLKDVSGVVIRPSGKRRGDAHVIFCV